MIRLSIGQLNFNSRAALLICIGCFCSGLIIGLIAAAVISEQIQPGVFIIMLLTFLPWLLLFWAIRKEVKTAKEQITE